MFHCVSLHLCSFSLTDFLGFCDCTYRVLLHYQYIIENPFTQKNISEIAEIYGVSESSMKRCFKSISGASLGTFMKRKRMEAAAELLRSEPTLSVGEIASLAWYENQGKFSGAFKSVYEMTPIAYRLKYS